jgi:hypothetical protein
MAAVKEAKNLDYFSSIQSILHKRYNSISLMGRIIRRLIKHYKETAGGKK